MKTLRYIFIFSLFLMSAVNAQESDKKEVFVIVEESPEFPGGMQAMMNFIRDNVKYPQSCRENSIGGKVFLKFIVTQTGEVTNVEVIKSSGASLLDQEAVRVVKSMPSWKPGYQTGRPVNVYFNLPINFKLAEGPGIEFNPSNTNSFYLEGKTFLENGNRKSAKESLQKAIGDVDAWYLLGVIAFEAGDKAAAKHYFDNVITNIYDQQNRAYKNAETYLKKYLAQQ